MMFALVCFLSFLIFANSDTITENSTVFPTTLMPCPDDALESPYNGDWCYQLFVELKTWNDAEDYCQLLGAHLVSIHNEIDNSFLSEYYIDNTTPQFHALNPYFWIGGIKPADVKTMYWIDKTPMDFTNLSCTGIIFIY